MLRCWHGDAGGMERAGWPGGLAAGAVASGFVAGASGGAETDNDGAGVLVRFGSIALATERS